MSKTPSKSQTKKPAKKSARKPAKKLPADVTLSVAAAHDKKALDVVLLDLRPGQAFTDFFLICTGASTRQVHAIADGIRVALGKEGLKPTIVEGETNGEWILMDYFDFIVHIFTPATREFYGLERLWGDAVRVELPAPSST